MFSYKQQYMQIDFLRLFRLCRSLDVAKRKRKMPIDYDDENTASATGRRLLKSLLDKHLFNGWPKPRTQYSTISIPIPTLDRSVFNIINSLFYNNNLMNACGELGSDVRQKYSELLEGNAPFVSTYFPYEIKIRLTDRNADTLSGFKPQERLYECALHCIEFKNKLDDYMPVFREFHEFYTTRREEIEVECQRLLNEERLRRQEERERQEEERLEASRRQQEERDRREEERRAALAAQVSVEVERTRQDAQDRFNQALSRFRSNRGGGGGA
jgi:hypothetical protein